MRTGPARLLAVMLVATLALAGCGGSDEPSGSSEPDSNAAGALTHVDGTVVVTDDGFTLTPSSGDPIEFALGPEVQAAQVRAIEASGEAARVSFRLTEDAPIAAAVKPAPKLGEGVESYEGTVTSVDDATLVVEGADGERSFDISAADPGAFDARHLRDHSEAGEPIKVYFDPSTPDLGIAYEDA